MARLYADENFHGRAVEELRKLGHDVLTVREAGNADTGIPDDEVLEYATQQSRILLTFNRKDFIQLHKKSNEHAGIIICTVDPNAEALAQRLHEKLREIPDMTGRLERIHRPP